MRSFSFLSIAATLAFSAFTSALPVNQARDLVDIEHNKINADILRARDLIDIEHNKVNADVLKSRDLIDIEDNEINADVLRSRDLLELEDNEVNADVLRPRDGLKSIPTILNDLTNDLSIVIDELSTFLKESLRYVSYISLFTFRLAHRSKCYKCYCFPSHRTNH